MLSLESITQSFTQRRVGPIGVDVGSRSLKLVQLSHDRSRVVESARYDFPLEANGDEAADHAQLIEGLRRVREGRKFRGREVVLCLNGQHLYVQNIRIVKPAAGTNIEQLVRDEAGPRLPLPAAEMELRYIEAADVRQGDTVRREVIVLACHRPKLEALLAAVEEAGLRPTAVEVEPLSLLRCYMTQFRRDQDQQLRALLVHVGHANTVVAIAQGSEALFIKYLDLGGKDLDQAVARHLQMPLAEAWSLRRHNGDRRADQQDPEVAHSLNDAQRAVIDKLVSEVSLCVRYHSVTFRGQPIARLILGGGEASPQLVEALSQKLDIKCELGDPLRTMGPNSMPGRKTQWDVAMGLALRTADNKP